MPSTPSLNQPSVLFLTQYYPPETGAPQARISELAKRLAGLGFEVQVLTGMPNYPQGEIHLGYRRKLWTREIQDSIPVLRTALYATKNARILPRLTNYFSFVLSSALGGPFLLERPDIIIVESPPLFLGLSGIALKRWFGCRMIFNVADLWPESAVRMGMRIPAPLLRLAEQLESLCYRQSDALTGQSPGIVEDLKNKLPASNVAWIPNGCDADWFSPKARDAEFRSKHNLQGKTIVGYAGLIGLAQGVDILVQVAAACRNIPELQFVIVGDGPEREKMETLIARKQLQNILMLGLLPKERLPSVVANFDIAFVPLKMFIPGALPSKVYEAMACQVPLILAAEGDAETLVRNAESGLCVPYYADAITEAVKKLVADPSLRTRLGKNGRNYVLKHHHRDTIASSMSDLLMRLVGGTSSSQENLSAQNDPHPADEHSP